MLSNPNECNERGRVEASRECFLCHIASGSSNQDCLDPFCLCRQMNSEEKVFQENSLKQHGIGHIVGIFRLALIPAGRNSRNARHDKSKKAWSTETLLPLLL